MPDTAPVCPVRINPALIPPWVEEYLTEQLVRSMRNFFCVPENRAKYEKWKAERDARLAAEAVRNDEG